MSYFKLLFEIIIISLPAVCNSVKYHVISHIVGSGGDYPLQLRFSHFFQHELYTLIVYVQVDEFCNPAGIYKREVCGTGRKTNAF
jgi:hypothetical protein